MKIRIDIQTPSKNFELSEFYQSLRELINKYISEDHKMLISIEDETSNNSTVYNEEKNRI